MLLIICSFPLYPFLPEPPVYGKRFSPWSGHLESRNCLAPWLSVASCQKCLNHIYWHQIYYVTSKYQQSNENNRFSEWYTRLYQTSVCAKHFNFFFYGIRMCYCAKREWERGLFCKISHESDIWEGRLDRQSDSLCHKYLLKRLTIQPFSCVSSRQTKSVQNIFFFATSASSPTTRATMSPQRASVGETMKSMKPGGRKRGNQIWWILGLMSWWVLKS